EVRQRADGQRDALAREPLDQPRALDAANAVIDPLRVQHVEGALDVGRRSLLAGVGDAVQAERAGPVEDAREFFRRVAALAAVEADADEVLAPRQRGVERRDRL